LSRGGAIVGSSRTYATPEGWSRAARPDGCVAPHPGKGRDIATELDVVEPTSRGTRASEDLAQDPRRDRGFPRSNRRRRRPGGEGGRHRAEPKREVADRHRRLATEPPATHRARRAPVPSRRLLFGSGDLGPELLGHGKRRLRNGPRRRRRFAPAATVRARAPWTPAAGSEGKGRARDRGEKPAARQTRAVAYRRVSRRRPRSGSAATGARAARPRGDGTALLRGDVDRGDDALMSWP